MRAAQSFEEDRAGPNSHRTDQRGPLALALDDLAALVRRWRRPGNGQCSILAVGGDGIAEPNLDLFHADRDSLDRVEHVLAMGELLAWLARRGARADRLPATTD